MLGALLTDIRDSMYMLPGARQELALDHDHPHIHWTTPTLVVIKGTFLLTFFFFSMHIESVFGCYYFFSTQLGQYTSERERASSLVAPGEQPELQRATTTPH